MVSTTSDWIILYTSKANWTYDIIITEISKKQSNKLVTHTVNYHFNTNFTHIRSSPPAMMAMSQQSLPPVNQYTGSFTEDSEGDGVRLNAYGHEDADIAFDPLSANRRFAGTADLAVLGSLVFAGPTRESIAVMVPDCIIPPANNTVRVDLHHHVGLSLGPAVDMTSWSPEANLERALCPASLADTLGLQRRAYWDEVNPLLKQWKNVNNSNCPDCKQFTKVNMGRHIHLKHLTYMC